MEGKNKKKNPFNAYYTLKKPGQRKNVPRKIAFERTLNPLKCIL